MVPVSEEEYLDLMDRYFNRFVLLARKWSGELAEDAVQEAFLKLVHRDRARGRPANITQWLFRAVKTTAIDFARRENRRARNEKSAWEQEGMTWFVENPGNHLDAVLLTNRLRALPDELYECVVLRIWFGLSFDEIAETTRRSKATVFRRYQEAISRIRG